MPKRPYLSAPPAQPARRRRFRRPVRVSPPTADRAARRVVGRRRIRRITVVTGTAAAAAAAGATATTAARPKTHCVVRLLKLNVVFHALYSRYTDTRLYGKRRF